MDGLRFLCFFYVQGAKNHGVIMPDANKENTINQVCLISTSVSALINAQITLYYTIPTFNDPDKEAFKNIVGKGENAGNQHFLLFPQCFQAYQRQKLSF